MKFKTFDMKIRTKLRVLMVFVAVIILAGTFNVFYTLNGIQGDATAINLSGSERMRSYKLAYTAQLYMNENDDNNKKQFKETIK